MPIGRKFERDIDLFLAEEFKVNGAFADWFRSKTKFGNLSARVADVDVSKSTNLGESDLVVRYEAENGHRFALFIEDKIDAPLQPDQAERYRLRAEREKERGECDDYEIILCAPSFYIDARTDLEGFNRKISFQEIREFLKSDSSERAQYRAEFVAIDAHRVNKWQREDDLATNEFWSAAYSMAKDEFMILEINKKPEMTKGSTWITFRPRDLPTQPKHVYIELKGGWGFVDLTFANTTAARFNEHIASLRESDMQVLQTTASAAIRLVTPSFTIEEGNASALPKLRQAFQASARLIAFFRQHRLALLDAAKEATA